MSWNNIPETLPPGQPGRYSTLVWLALPDGRVMPGQCMRSEQRSPARHDWFLEPQDGQPCHKCPESFTPVAWQPIVPPLHPMHDTRNPALKGELPKAARKRVKT